MELTDLFSSGKIGSVQIKNRIVRSATFSHMADKYGYIGERALRFHKDLAQGGTGLIITEATAVDPGGAGGRARRGHQREARPGLAPGRPGQRRLRHPHPRGHRRRGGAARGHRLHHRHRHDRPLRLKADNHQLSIP